MEGTDVRQYSQCSQECHTQVKQKSTCWFNMPPLGTLLWWEGKRTTWLSSAMPTQQDGAVQFVQRNESQMLTQRHFGRWTGGSESGLTFSNVDLVCVCVFCLFKNIIYKCCCIQMYLFDCKNSGLSLTVNGSAPM